jgi:ParB family chromosome partitioning protein
MDILTKLKALKNSKPKPREKKIYYLSPSQIIPNPNQTRTSFANVSLSRLADSIQKYGILHPIIIRKRDCVPYIEAAGEKIYSQEYEIVSGERRWRAAMLLSLDEIPCILTDADEKTALELHLTENVMRDDLHFLEETEGASMLIRGFGAKADEGAEILSITKPALANRFKILRLSDAEKKRIIQSELSERHVVAISRVENEEDRSSLMDQAVSTSMNAAETERAVNMLLHPTYRTKGDEKRKITVISDIGFFLNSLNRSIGLLENAGIKVDKSELDSDGVLEIKIKIRKKSKSK